MVDLEVKVADAIKLLRDNEPVTGYHVGFSGGKDSVVVLDLVKKSGVKYRAVYQVTTVDPPELVRFIRANYPDVEFRLPKRSMRELIIHHGFPPTRRFRYCCDRLKETKGRNMRLVTGVRWEESFRRSGYLEVEQDKRIKSMLHIRPILTWNEAHVWMYIESRHLPYCSLYDEGFSRLGCIMCPLAGSTKMRKDAARWPHIYKMYMNAFDTMLKRFEKLGRPRSQKTAQEMMDWWLYDKEEIARRKREKEHGQQA